MKYFPSKTINFNFAIPRGNPLQSWKMVRFLEDRWDLHLGRKPLVSGARVSNYSYTDEPMDAL